MKFGILLLILPLAYSQSGESRTLLTVAKQCIFDMPQCFVDFKELAQSLDSFSIGLIAVLVLAPLFRVGASVGVIYLVLSSIIVGLFYSCIQTMDPAVQIIIMLLVGGYGVFSAFFSQTNYNEVQGETYMHLIDVLKVGEGKTKDFEGLHMAKQSDIYEVWKEGWTHYENKKMLALGERLYAKMGITSRQSWDTSFTHSAPEEKKYIKKYHANVPMHVRSKLFVDTARHAVTAMGAKLLKRWHRPKSDITHVVGICSTGWVEPTLAIHIVHECGLNAETGCMNITFNGCFAGITGLRTAQDLVKSDPTRNVLVVAVECPGWLTDPTGGRSAAISMMLFGDGCAGCIVSGERKGYQMQKFSSYIIPKSEHILGFCESRSTTSDAYHIVLGADIASTLREASARLVPKIAKLVLQHGVLNIMNLPFAVHSGGRKILDEMGKVLGKSNLEESYNSLNTRGNMGTVSIFDVIYRYVSKDEPNVFCIGVGPGVTIEYGLLQKLHQTTNTKPREANFL